MNEITFSYNQGLEIIPESVLQDISDTITSSTYHIEKYTINKFRDEFLSGIKRKGWSDSVILNRASKISITSEKGDVGLCLQTGNVSRVYADLLKLQCHYAQGRIKVGIIIVPTQRCAKQYTSNSATYERLIRELPIFSQVITMPIIVVGFYN